MAASTAHHSERMIEAPVRYAVVFREGAGPVVAGALDVSEGGLLLSGRVDGRPHELGVALTDVVEIKIGRFPAERLNGYPTVLLVRGRMPAVQVAPMGAGLLNEVADLLIALAAEPTGEGDELAVVVPLRQGCLERAKRLLELGPPLDAAVVGLTEHEVYLREGEAVFVFRGPDVAARVGQAMSDPDLWRAGISWQDCIAGPPEITKIHGLLSADETPAYRWTSS